MQIRWLVPQDLLLVNGDRLVLYDVSDPVVPVELAARGSLPEVDILGPYVYSPAHDAGVAIVSLAGCPGFVSPEPPRRPSGRVGRP